MILITSGISEIWFSLITKQLEIDPVIAGFCRFIFNYVYVANFLVRLLDHHPSNDSETYY